MVDLWNTRREVEIYPEWDVSPLEDTVHTLINTLIHTYEDFRVSTPAGTVFRSWDETWRTQRRTSETPHRQ